VWAYHEVENLGWAEGMTNPDPVPDDSTAGTMRANRLDHVALCATDTEELAGFLTEVLDFDASEVLIGPDGRQVASWMYCTNTMHDVAIVPGPEGGLHHVAFYADSRAAVVNGIDLLRHRGVPTMNFGLSRHGIAGVTTTYFHDPAGIRNELFYGPYPTPGVPGQVPPVQWEMPDFARGAFYYENELDHDFMTEVT
jgi:catechol 2,3-dioxygenase